MLKKPPCVDPSVSGPALARREGEVGRAALVMQTRGGPRRIERIELEEEAASGGMGTIYRARDTESGERVAVKLMQGFSREQLSRFEREARVLSRIRHPGVVRYIRHGWTEDGEAYLVMEWLDGEDLRTRLERTGLTLHESVTLGARAAKALAAIHEHGVLHRDIKPANLFLLDGEVDRIKIIDLGLARAQEASIGVTRTGMVIGTPAYMAPEQARGARDIDARADLFSLGCVLFRCLSGRAPFEGSHTAGVLTKVLLEEAPRLGVLRPGMPRALEDLVARLLSKDPGARPEHAEAVAKALAAIDPDELDASLEAAPPSRSLWTLTGSEQRVVAVLFVGGAGDAQPGRVDSDTLVTAPPDVSLAVEPEAVLHDLAVEHGAKLDHLLDGTRVVTLLGADAATDQAARAARCALALRAVLPGVPMGLSTGRGEIGGHLPVGDAIDRAARMLARSARALAASPAGAEGHDAPAAIAIDEVTAALLDPSFEVERAADGLDLLGRRDLELGARTLLGKATPFVGREWEATLVAGFFDQCVEEVTAGAMVITAPAGMGKSRLAHEVVDAIRRARPEVEVWVGRGDPLRAGTALGLLGHALRRGLGLAQGDWLEEQRRRVAERVAQHVPAAEAARVAEFLGEILGVPFPDEDSPALRAARRDALLMSEQTRNAWEDMLTAECAAHPLLLVLEDLQWSDLPTVRLLDASLAHQERRAWVVLALGRPEVHDQLPRLWAGRNVQEIRLKPLARRASERLVRAALGPDAGPAAIERIAPPADGHAYYLEELIRAEAERGAHRDGSRDASEPSEARSAGDAALPETVLAMAQARLDRLDPEPRRVLRAASVFGAVLWPAAVTHLLGGAPAAALTGECIEALVADEMLVPRRESRFAGEPELAFRHGLLREAAYATLTEGDRALGHRLAGEWLEAHGEGDPTVLAQHFERGRDRGRAGGLYLRAAELALRGGDPDAAIARATQARACDLAGAAREACLGLLADGHAWKHEWAAACRYADELLASAAPGSAAWVKATSTKVGQAFVAGESQGLVDALAALEGLADPPPETVGVIVNGLRTGVFALCMTARFPMAEALVRRIDALVTPLAGADLVARGRMHSAHAHLSAWATGDGWAALASAEAAAASFAEAGDRRLASFAHAFVGHHAWALGDVDRAERDLRGVLAGGGGSLAVLFGEFYLAWVLLDRGKLREARALAAQRAERGSVAGAEVRGAEGRWLLGEIALREGDAAAAEREIEGALGLLEATAVQWAAASATLAQARIAQGRAAEALAGARAAVDALAGGHGFRGVHVRLAHAEALHAAGDPTAASSALTAVCRRIRAAAAAIPDGDARRRFLEHVPENARALALGEAWGG